MQDKYPLFRTITLVCYILLLLLLSAGVFYAGPDQLGAKLVLALLLNSGLLLVSYILFQGTKRAYIWLCFILLLYFIGIVQALFAPSEPVAMIAEWLLLIATVTCFCSSMLAARFHGVSERSP